MSDYAGMVVQEASGSACAKAILLGEHAVVYGEPAIAVPLPELRATAISGPGLAGRGVEVIAHDLGDARYGRESGDERGRGLLRAALRTAAALLGEGIEPDMVIELSSLIPVARGLGSSAAVAAAIVRATVASMGTTLAPDRVSPLVFECETLFHGTPSGVDNTVVSFERAVWFQRGAPHEFLTIGAPLCLLLADTGAPSRTSDTVGRVRDARQHEPKRVNAALGEIGALVCQARDFLAVGNLAAVGRTMNANHELLRTLGVSTPTLDALVLAAQRAGAWGAKLCGGGGGGCMVALVPDQAVAAVRRALKLAGAAALYEATVEPVSALAS